MQPTWLVHLLAVLMLVTSTYGVARLVAARVWRRSLHRDTDLAHAADGVAMAGMLVGGSKILPAGVWEVVFGAFTFWFVLRGVRFVTRFGVGRSTTTPTAFPTTSPT